MVPILSSVHVLFEPLWLDWQHRGRAAFCNGEEVREVRNGATSVLVRVGTSWLKNGFRDWVLIGACVCLFKNRIIMLSSAVQPGIQC